MRAEGTPRRLVVAVLLLGLAGCSGSDDAKPKATPTGPTQQQICDALTSQERAALVGKPVDEPVGRAPEYAEFSCRWGAAGDKDTVVQIVSAPVSEWVKKLPSLLDNIAKLPHLSRADRRQVRSARQLLSSGSLDDRTGCQVFSLLAEIGGFPRGSKTSVSYLTSGKRPLVAAQHCEGDRFTSVAFTFRGDRGQAGVDAARAVAKVAGRVA